MNENLEPELLAHMQEVISLPLIDVHRRVAGWPNPIAEAALQMLVQDLRDNPNRLNDEDTDSMHNLVMHAARVERSDIEEQLLRAFADACPGNVDLQADLLQFHYGKRWNPGACERQWQILNDDKVVEPAARKANWRYWVFGALYHARVKHDVAAAQELVIQGLEEVPGRNKSAILRNLENVFIDFATSPLFNRVLEALRRGVADGWPLGYTLALKLAILLQQQAFVSGDAKSEENVGRLREALDWLSVAESLFTNDPNHPITEIYRARINILMGLENYREAIDYIEAFYSHDPKAAQRDPSLRAQFILSCRRAGEADLWKKVMGEFPEEEGMVRSAKPEGRIDTMKEQKS